MGLAPKYNSRPLNAAERSGAAAFLVSALGWTQSESVKVLQRIAALAIGGESPESVMRRLNPPAQVYAPPHQPFVIDTTDPMRDFRRPRPAPISESPSKPVVPEPGPSPTAVLDEAVRITLQVLTCRKCGMVWKRRRMRGRPPIHCSDCRR